MTRVLIAGDIGFYRAGLAYALPQHGLDVVGTAATGPEAVATSVDLRPDVALIDVTMASSAEAIRLIGRHAPAVKVIALSVWEREADVLACVEAGAAGYVTRDASIQDVVESIARAVRDEPLASPRVVALLMRRVALLASSAVDTPGVRSLTSRERDVIELIDQGLSNKQIAARLSIEVGTVKNHVHNILEKLSVNRRGEAAARVRDSSLYAAPGAGRRFEPSVAAVATASADEQPRGARGTRLGDRPAQGRSPDNG